MSDSPIVGPDAMPGILDQFLSRDEMRSREFWKYFDGRMARRRIPVPDLHECVDKAVYYDNENNIDARLIETLIIKDDIKLYHDVVHFVFEDFINTPASPLTLAQFKAQLTRRLEQLGF